jgi:hypothetical protein
MSKRFAESVDLEDILRCKYMKSTLKNNKYAEKLLRDYCLLKGYNYDIEMNSEKWDQILCLFYASLKKFDGTTFNSSSLKSIRYSISRLLHQKLNNDILKDASFVKSNEVFSALMKKLKNEGKGSSKHFNVVEKEDLQKIQELNASSPVELQWKVWVSIMLHFLNRGMENMHNLMKNDLIINEDANGKKCLRLRDFLTKNHQGTNNKPSTEAVMYSTLDDNCPVALIEHYMTKLNPKNEYFWQKPKLNVNCEASVWYHNQKIGVNKISKFMTDISLHLKMSRKYTNHCLRATGITTLGKNFQDTEISSFSGHKSLNALSIYKRTSNEIKESMSGMLHNSIFEGSSKSLTSLPDIQIKKVIPSQSTSSPKDNVDGEVFTSIDINETIPSKLTNLTENRDQLDEWVNEIDLDNLVPAQQVLQPQHALQSLFSNCSNISIGVVNINWNQK